MVGMMLSPTSAFRPVAPPASVVIGSPASGATSVTRTFSMIVPACFGWKSCAWAAPATASAAPAASARRMVFMAIPFIGGWAAPANCARGASAALIGLNP